MDWFLYVLEIRFSSPLLIPIAIVAALSLFLISRRFRTIVSSPYLGFFYKERVSKTTFFLVGLYRFFVFVILCTLVLAIGNPVHEERRIEYVEATPYIIIFDASGSLASNNSKGEVAVSFQESLLNTFRRSLITFIQEQKDTSEFFIMLYSDTPYAARYFAGDKEAQIQAVEFFESLPKEIRSWQASSRTFYLKGTHTAFALEAASRYYLSFPEQYRSSVFIIMTDFQDTQVHRVARNIDNLIDQGLERDVYVITIPDPDGEKNLSSFQKDIVHADRVRIFQAHDELSLDAVFDTIGHIEQPKIEIGREKLEFRPLQREFILVALIGIFIFVLTEELIFRKIP